jgi:hypothetical protein
LPSFCLVVVWTRRKWARCMVHLTSDYKRPIQKHLSCYIGLFSGYRCSFCQVTARLAITASMSVFIIQTVCPPSWQ